MRQLVIISVIQFLSFLVYSQNSDYTFEHITTDQGLSQTSVHAVFKDSRGFMWFGTLDGLNKYDGYSFEVFRPVKNDTTSLPGNRITYINEDLKGNLWVGTTKGLSILDVKTYKFKTLNIRRDNFRGKSVTTINVYKDSTIYVGTTTGFSIYYMKENRFQYFTLNPEDPNSLNNVFVNDILRTRDDKVYISTRHDNIQLFDQYEYNFTDISYKEKYFGSNRQKKLFEDTYGKIWIGAQAGGLHFYDPSTGQSVLFDESPDGIHSRNTHGGFNISNNNELWIGTRGGVYGGGINILNLNDHSFSYLYQDLKDVNSLSNNSITTIYIDDEDIYWVGTFGGGVNVWNKHKTKFKTYKHDPFDTNSLSKNPIISIFEDSKGRIWFGTDGAGMCYYDRYTDKFTRYTIEDGLSSNVVKCINEDVNGNILLGTFQGGFMVFNVEEGTFINYKTVKNDPTSIETNNVWNIFRDSRDRIWLSILNGPVDLFNAEDGTFEHLYFNEDEQEIPLRSPSLIIEDESGKLWTISQNSSIFIVNPDTRKAERLIGDPNDESKIASTDIRALALGKEYAWIGTNGAGLDRLNRMTKEVKHYTVDNGLPSNTITALMLDDSGNIWGSTTNGLFKFFPKNDSLKLFDITDGLQSKEFKANSFCKLRNGQMIFGGVNGFNIFHPDSIKDNPYIPSIVFTDFKILNKSVTYGSEKAFLKNHIDFTEKIVLNYKQSVFTINYSALNYTSTIKNQYRYKLIGFDKDWIEAGDQRFASYTNLDAGKYTFHVIASNNDGLWNMEGRKLLIKVKPPWWKTWFFRIFVVLLIAAIIYSGMQYRELQLKRDKQILEEKIKEGETEVNKQKSEIQEQQKILKEKELAERITNWVNQGMTTFGELISENRDNLENLSRKLISKLVSYVGATQGGLYVVKRDSENNEYLELEGSYAVDRKKLKNKIVKSGEGLVGTSFKLREVTEIDDLPDDYSVFSSGLGEKQVKHLVLIPIINNDLINGIIELTSFEKLDTNKVNFIKKLAESLSSTIQILVSSSEKSELLAQANEQAEELRAQQEEMRQNLEELTATQEEIDRIRKNDKKREQELLNREKQFVKKEKELQKKIAQLENKLGSS